MPAPDSARAGPKVGGVFRIVGSALSPPPRPCRSSSRRRHVRSCRSCGRNRWPGAPLPGVPVGKPPDWIPVGGPDRAASLVRAAPGTPRSASTSLNPRARLLEVRARGLSDVLVNPAAAHRMLRRALPGSPSLSRRRDPGIGRERCDGAGGRVRGGCGSAVSGRGRRVRMCGIGRAGAVLHIRPGPAGDGSAESRGNSPALNAVEILPCAEGPSLHMGARPLKTNILGKPRNHAEDSESTRGGGPLQCATPPHGPGGTRARDRHDRQMTNTAARAGSNLTSQSTRTSTSQHRRTGREQPSTSPRPPGGPPRAGPSPGRSVPP